MSLKQDELFSSSSRASRARITPADDRGLYVATFAADSGVELLVAGVPVVFDDIAGLWNPYTQSEAEVDTLTSNATPATAGQFQLRIDGHVINFLYDVTAATMQTDLRNLIHDHYDVVDGVACVATTGVDLGDASAVITMTFKAELGQVVVNIDQLDITGNPHALAEVSAGVNPTDIRGVVWEEPIQIDASDEVLGVIMVKGEAERDDMNTADVRALLRGSPSEAELDAALSQPDVRNSGIFVRGLSTVH